VLLYCTAFNNIYFHFIFFKNLPICCALDVGVQCLVH
jgi:hypothetical protein